MAMLGLAGVAPIDTRVAAVTVNSVELLTVPEVALILAVPMPTLCANPDALIVAVEGVSEDQVAVLVRFCVLPSV